MKNWLRRVLLPWLGARVIQCVAATVRVRMHDPHGFLPQVKTRGPMLFAFWHNRLFLMACFYKKYQPGRKLAALISQSKDGQIIADIIDQLGLRSVRGSTSRRGTEALLSMIRLVKDEGVDVAITPDGPRGPRYVLQPGILHLSQATERPIIPVRYDLKWKKELATWDRFQIPYFFTECLISLGNPMSIPTDASESDMSSFQKELAAQLGAD